MWVLPLALGACLGWGLWTPPGAAASAGGRPREGALEELEHARLEQALIRAETTAQLLRLLEAHTGPEVGP